MTPKVAPRNDPTQRLADMKAALESDPRPRYVVVKDGMDHGPFTAVELLQQIAQHIFIGDHALRDAFTGDERFIKDGLLDTGAIRPIARAGYHDYFVSTPETKFSLRRPKGGGADNLDDIKVAAE